MVVLLQDVDLIPWLLLLMVLLLQDVDLIPWLLLLMVVLLQDVDLIPWLLLPLAGPTPDTFSEEEIDQLPVGIGNSPVQCFGSA